MYEAHLVSEGLSLRAASRALRLLAARSHVSVWRWVQGLAPLEALFQPRRVRCFLVDEGMVRVKGLEGWVWVAYEPCQRMLLALRLSWTRSNLTAWLFLRRLVERYGRHPVYTDGAPWHPEACRGLSLERRLLPDEYRSLVERAVQRLKGRTEGFDDHYPCSREGCRLEDVQEWLKTSNLHQQPEYLKLIGYIREVIGLK